MPKLHKYNKFLDMDTYRLPMPLHSNLRNRAKKLAYNRDCRADKKLGVHVLHGG